MYARPPCWLHIILHKEGDLKVAADPVCQPLRPGGNCLDLSDLMQLHGISTHIRANVQRLDHQIQDGPLNRLDNKWNFKNCFLDSQSRSYVWWTPDSAHHDRCTILVMVTASNNHLTPRSIRFRSSLFYRGTYWRKIQMRKKISFCKFVWYVPIIFY